MRANSYEAQIGPASNSSAASRIVTPQLFSWLAMAQSSEEGPRSPLMPGCTIKQRWSDQTSLGMAIFSIGARISSGFSRETAAIIASPVAATQTEISWPRSPSSIHRRWLRLLWADVKKRIRMVSSLYFSFVEMNRNQCSCGLRPKAQRKERHKTTSSAPSVQGALRRTFYRRIQVSRVDRNRAR